MAARQSNVGMACSPDAATQGRGDGAPRERKIRTKGTCCFYKTTRTVTGGFFYSFVTSLGEREVVATEVAGGRDIGVALTLGPSCEVRVGRRVGREQTVARPRRALWRELAGRPEHALKT